MALMNYGADARRSLHYTRVLLRFPGSYCVTIRMWCDFFRNRIKIWCCVGTLMGDRCGFRRSARCSRLPRTDVTGVDFLHVVMDGSSSVEGSATPGVCDSQPDLSVLRLRC